MKHIKEYTEFINEGDQVLTKADAIIFLQKNDAKYYKVETTPGVSSGFKENEKEKAIQAIEKLNHKSFQLQKYGQTISLFQLPNAKHEELVRSFGLNN